MTEVSNNKRYVIADVFTQRPLCGNPVAVFTKAYGMSTALMQSIAKELNLSETTFVLPPKNGGDFHIKIFTPVNELPFAGHPTLGTAIVLGENLQTNIINLETKMGIIPFELTRNMDNKISEATMKQPIPIWEPYEHSKFLLKALSLENSTLPIEIYNNGPRHVFVGLPSVSRLSALKPDLNMLANLKDVAINCFAKDGKYWRMRMFSPAYGVAEDAATGSASGPLALHLARYGIIKYGQWIKIRQGVEMGRNALMRSIVEGNVDKIDSIRASGSAIVVARGVFEL